MSTAPPNRSTSFRRPHPQRRRSSYIDFGDGEHAHIPESNFATEDAPQTPQNPLRSSVDGGFAAPILAHGTAPARARRGSVVRGRSGSMAGGVRASSTGLATTVSVALEITKEEIEEMAARFDVSDVRVREVAVAAEGDKNLMIAILQSQKESEDGVPSETKLQFCTLDTVKRIINFLSLPDSAQNEVIAMLNECKGDASLCAERLMAKSEQMERTASQAQLLRKGSGARGSLYNNNGIAASSARVMTDFELAEINDFMETLGPESSPVDQNKATLMGEFPTATERQVEQALQLTDQHLPEARVFLRDAATRDPKGVTEQLEKVMMTNGQRPRPARRADDVAYHKLNGAVGAVSSFTLPSVESAAGATSARLQGGDASGQPDSKPSSAPAYTATRGARARRGSVLSPDEPTPTIGSSLPRTLSNAVTGGPLNPRRGSTVRLPDFIPTSSSPGQSSTGNGTSSTGGHSSGTVPTASTSTPTSAAAPAITKNPRRRGSVAAVNELNLAVLNHQNTLQQGQPITTTGTTRAGQQAPSLTLPATISSPNVAGGGASGADVQEALTPRTRLLYEATFQKHTEAPKASSLAPATAPTKPGTKRASSLPNGAAAAAPSPPPSGNPNGHHRRTTAADAQAAPSAPAAPGGLPPPPPPPPPPGNKATVAISEDAGQSSAPAAPAAPAGLPPPPPPPGYKPPTVASSGAPAAPAGLPPPPPPPGYKPPVTVSEDATQSSAPAAPAGLPPPPPPPGYKPPTTASGGPSAPGGPPPPPPPPPPGLGRGGPPPPPPPPPGLGKGGPPPPPMPPGMAGAGAGAASAASQSITKNIPFSLVKEVKDNSAFAEGQKTLSKDIKEGLLQRFARVNPKKEEEDEEANKVVQILDATRERNVGIVLQFMRLPIQQLEASIRTFDELTLGEEHVSGLAKIIPTESDMRAIDRAEKDNGAPWTREEIQQLSLPVRFFLMARTIDHYADRIHAWNLKFEFMRAMEDFETKLNVALKGTIAVLFSSRLPDVLSYLLSVSNFLNTGSRYEEAKGFPISDLPNIMNFKTTDGKSTLLQVVVEMLDQERPEVHEVVNELLPHVEKARDIDVPGIEVEIKNFHNRLQKCGALVRALPNDRRWTNMLGKFICKAVPALKDVEELAKQVDARGERVRDFLCESKDSFTLQEGFRILAGFAKRYRLEFEKLEERKHREALQAERDAERGVGRDCEEDVEDENDNSADQSLSRAGLSPLSGSNAATPSKRSTQRAKHLEEEIISSVPAERKATARSRRYSQY